MPDHLASLPPGEDPDSLILKQGPDAFAAVLAAACSPMKFLLDGMSGQFDPATQAGLMQALKPVIELATHAQSSAQAELMMHEASVALGVGVPSLMKDLQAARRRKYRFQTATAPGPDSSAAPSPDVPGNHSAPTPADTSEPPPEELDLAILLCANASPELAGFVRQWIRYPLLTHPGCRAIVTALAEEEDLFSSLDDAPDSTKTLAARIANTPSRIAGGEDISTPERAAQDLVLRIWLQYLQGRQRKIQRTLLSAPAAEKLSLLTEFNSLAKTQTFLRRGWPAAEPHLALLLDQLDSEAF